VPEYATVSCPEGDQPERRFERIIGKSAALESVLDQVEQVASTDSTAIAENEAELNNREMMGKANSIRFQTELYIIYDEIDTAFRTPSTRKLETFFEI